MSRILVTGATGNVGSGVVPRLVDAGHEVIAASRKPVRSRAANGRAHESRHLDFLDRSTWSDALEGVHRVFLVRPPAIADVRNSLCPFIDHAATHGIEHIVFLSVAGAGKNRIVPHRKVEDHLRATGARHTNLRPGFFAQNLETAYRQDIVEDDRIYLPAGRRPVNWIDTRDIAEVAALVLDDPVAHRGASYTLAGPGAVAWAEVTDALTSVLGRPIRYEPASVPGYVRHLSRRGLPLGAIAVQTVLHVLLRFGQGATEDPTLERLLGRRGTSIRQYIEDHASRWANAARDGQVQGRSS